MLDKVFAGMKVSDLDTSAPPVRISRVNLRVDNETSYTAGDDSGRTIEKECPWGTQAMCDGILAQVRSVGYQPFSGVDCLLDPAAEVGDGITIGGVYSVLARTDITFDGLYTADPSAPGSDEVDDEYPYKSRASRLADRQRAQIYSRIIKTANMIRLEVVDEVRKLNARITLEVDRITTEVNDVNAGLSSKIEQTASSLTSQITDTANGLNSKIEQTASSLTTKINDTQNGLSSQIQQTASSLTAQITNKEAGLKNEIKATADSLTAKISATDGRVTSLSASLDGISLRVQNAEGGIGQLELTASSLSTRISNAEGGVSTLQQTAASLQSQITGTNNAVSSISQYVDSITLSVSNGMYSSTISLKAGSATISSREITFNGMVTFSDLAGNKTIINGSTIDTKTLFLDSLYGDSIYLNDSEGEIAAELRTWDSSSAAGQSALQVWARAIGLYAYNRRGGGDIFIRSYDGYVTLDGGSGVTCANDFYPNADRRYDCGTSFFRWNNVYAQDGAISSSDRLEKFDIEYDMSKYEPVFDALRPCSYRRRYGDNYRAHTGFIAQDVAAARDAAGLPDSELAAYCQWEIDGITGCGLRYEELIALAVHEIQRAKARIAELERKIAQWLPLP